MKKRSLKRRKIGIFPKGLVHGFGQKIENVSRLSFRHNSLGKCVSRHSRKKNAFLERKKAVLNYKNKELTN